MISGQLVTRTYGKDCPEYPLAGICTESVLGVGDVERKDRLQNYPRKKEKAVYTHFVFYAHTA